MFGVFLVEIDVFVICELTKSIIYANALPLLCKKKSDNIGALDSQKSIAEERCHTHSQTRVSIYLDWEIRKITNRSVIELLWSVLNFHSRTQWEIIKNRIAIRPQGTDNFLLDENGHLSLDEQKPNERNKKNAHKICKWMNEWNWWRLEVKIELF